MIYSDDEDYEGEIDGIEEVGTANLTRPRSASITLIILFVLYSEKRENDIEKEK